MSPWVLPDPTPPPPQKSLTMLTNPLNWYWGESAGTSASAVPGHLTWLLTGIQAAGPKLTPKTFQQGLFSLPASGGAAQGYPTGGMTAYGKTAGLPYDEYLSTGLDFSPVWWDPETTGPSQGTGSEGNGRRRGTPTAPSATGAARCRRSSSAGSTRRRRSTSSTRARRRRPSTWATAPGARARAAPGNPVRPDPAGFVAKAYGENGS